MTKLQNLLEELRRLRGVEAENERLSARIPDWNRRSLHREVPISGLSSPAGVVSFE
jgi:hypothetical protein